MAESEPRIEHPNRKKAASKLTRLLVIVLLLASAGLVIIVTLGGWSALEGAKALQIAYILLYLLLAYFVARWSRGVLPLIAALAIVLLIFAAVSAPAWFDRTETGFTDPALPSELLGLLTALIVPVQILLIAVAMSGFRQAWNVEVEVGADDDEEERGGGRGERRITARERVEDDEPRTEPGTGSGGPSPAAA
jgi:FtsH-binding integral membrane protein